MTIYGLSSGVWPDPELQLDRAHQLWPDSVLPDPPVRFRRRSRTGVLLLHVPRSFDELWDVIQVPRTCIKSRWIGLKSDSKYLRLAPNVPSRSDPVWLEFDYAANQNVRPDSLWGRSDLAASEVLSALIQNPDWATMWGDRPYPNLSGYQFCLDGEPLDVPFLDWRQERYRLMLSAGWANSASERYSSPTVREL